LEQFADSISIEPLIIEEVVIKAKSHKNEWIIRSLFSLKNGTG
jgi:hypothetical protein